MHKQIWKHFLLCIGIGLSLYVRDMYDMTFAASSLQEMPVEKKVDQEENKEQAQGLQPLWRGLQFGQNSCMLMDASIMSGHGCYEQCQAACQRWY